MIEIKHFEKLLTLLKKMEDDQNININYIVTCFRTCSMFY